jgi:hypothetical protein
MTPSNTASDFGHAQVKEKIKALGASQDHSHWPHYLLRRLPILGAMLALSAGLILLFSYLGTPKDEPFGMESLDWLTPLAQAYHNAVSWFFGISMIAILLFTFGNRKDDSRSKSAIRILVNGFMLGVAMLPWMLPIQDIRHMLIFTFGWGIILCVLSWQANRTFGYTRIWARSSYYKSQLELLEVQIAECGLDGPSASEKRFEIMRNLQKEIYHDTVGDTFYFLDRLTKKSD